jgi:hypothetical protein
MCPAPYSAGERTLKASRGWGNLYRVFKNQRRFIMNDINSFNPSELPTITKLAGLKRIKARTTERTKISLSLKGAFKLADILEGMPRMHLDLAERQYLYLLIKKLRNAQPSVEF